MTFATADDAEREYVHNVGQDRPDLAWILTDRDAWHRNPFYKGPPQPHPDGEDERPQQEPSDPWAWIDDDIPF